MQRRRSLHSWLLSASLAATFASVLASQTPQTPPAEPAPAEQAPPPQSEAADKDVQPPAPPPRFVAMPPPPPDPNEFKVSSDVEVVLLDVSVKNEDGGWVSGLTKDAFKVFEDKAEQPISIFGAQDSPVTVGLVIDNSGSVRPKKHEIVTAALVFAGNSNPHDEMFLVNFNDRVIMGLPPNVPFTDDKTLLRQAMLVNPAQGRTALYDALRTALEHLDKGRRDKKTLVLISDGGDNASDTTHDEILRMAQESTATIYTVGIFNPEDKDKNPGFLKDLARITGGEAFMPEDISHLVGVCEKIAKDIRNRYTIGYSPTNINYDGKVRKLRVTAADGTKKFVVRTRTQYIATARPSYLQSAAPAGAGVQAAAAKTSPVPAGKTQSKRARRK